MIIYFEDDKDPVKKLTVEDLKKALDAGAKNANELHRSLKAQFGMTNINHNRRLK